MRIAIVSLMFVAGLLAPALSPASDKALETSHLIVSDTTGNLSNEQLKRLADSAQETLNKIIMPELEANWLNTLRANGKTTKESVSIVLKLFETNPDTACSEAQKLVTSKR